MMIASAVWSGPPSFGDGPLRSLCFRVHGLTSELVDAERLSHLGVSTVGSGADAARPVPEG